MMKYDEQHATKLALALVEKAISAGFISQTTHGDVAGARVIDFMNTVVDGLTGKSSEQDQPSE